MRQRILSSLLFAWPAIALAQQNDIRIENAWSRPAVVGRTGVIYLTVTDTGAPDRLIAATSPVATRAELHGSYTENDVARMRAITALPVDQGKPLILAPGGYHIMLTGLKQTLKQGDTFPITLSFERSGQVTASATVQVADARMPPGHDAPH
jgi:periplasmic copper chaperone A